MKLYLLLETVGSYSGIKINCFSLVVWSTKEQLFRHVFNSSFIKSKPLMQEKDSSREFHTFNFDLGNIYTIEKKKKFRLSVSK